MSFEYDPYNDSSQDSEEDFDMGEYMEEVRSRALQKLTNLEIAAIFEDLKDFLIRYREAREDENTQWKVD